MVNKTKYIEEFRKLYELKQGKAISSEVAAVYFEELVALINETYRPINRGFSKNINAYGK